MVRAEIDQSNMSDGLTEEITYIEPLPIAPATSTLASGDPVILVANENKKSSRNLPGLRMELFSESKTQWSLQHRQIFCQVGILFTLAANQLASKRDWGLLILIACRKLVGSKRNRSGLYFELFSSKI